jgi:hypothetical protein
MFAFLLPRGRKIQGWNDRQAFERGKLAVDAVKRFYNELIPYVKQNKKDPSLRYLSETFCRLLVNTFPFPHLFVDGTEFSRSFVTHTKEL